MIHYYLCIYGSDIYRIGVTGDRNLIEKYLSQYYQSVEFIDDYKEPFYYDIDNNIGIGNRVIDGGRILTCKLVHTITSRKTSGSIFDYLDKVHKQVKERENNETKG